MSPPAIVGCVFDGAVLGGAVVGGCVFGGVVLGGRVFVGAVFDGELFAGVLFAGVLFDGAVLGVLVGCEVDGRVVERSVVCVVVPDSRAVVWLVPPVVVSPPASDSPPVTVSPPAVVARSASAWSGSSVVSLDEVVDSVVVEMVERGVDGLVYAAVVVLESIAAISVPVASSVVVHADSVSASATKQAI